MSRTYVRPTEDELTAIEAAHATAGATLLAHTRSPDLPRNLAVFAMIHTPTTDEVSDAAVDDVDPGARAAGKPLDYEHGLPDVGLDASVGYGHDQPSECAATTPSHACDAPSGALPLSPALVVVVRCSAPSDRGGMTCELPLGHDGSHKCGPFVFSDASIPIADRVRWHVEEIRRMCGRTDVHAGHSEPSTVLTRRTPEGTHARRNTAE